MDICGNQSKLNVVLFAILIFILTTLLVCFVWVTFFADVPYEETEPEVLGGYFEGDMILPHGVEGRNVMRDEKYRWPNKKVIYKFDHDSYPYGDIGKVLAAFREIESVSCVEFVPAGLNDAKFMSIVSKKVGCFSTVGYKDGELFTNLWKVCRQKDVIMHELLHVLGIVHQQSASNRDDYVKIMEENIVPKQLHNFEKLSSDYVTDFGTPYDYGSIMHYGAYFFSKNGKKTIVTIPDPNVEIGQRRHLSMWDKIKINIMYKCYNYTNTYV